MISLLRGTVVHTEPDAVVVDVGGVGFSIAVTPQLSQAAHPGAEITLHTHLVVREDALSLFGFDEREELRVFTQLLSVTGVGPKSALGILATLTVPQIADAVAADDDAPFRRVSGIGPKTAKLIVVQLTGKIEAAAPAVGARTTGASSSIAPQVVQALVGLGWSEKVAADAVSAAADTASVADSASVPALLRLTLAALGPARKEAVGG